VEKLFELARELNWFICIPTAYGLADFIKYWCCQSPFPCFKPGWIYAVSSCLFLYPFCCYFVNFKETCMVLHNTISLHI